MHGTTSEQDARYRKKASNTFQRLVTKVGEFALNTQNDSSTQSKKMQKRLLCDFSHLFYEDEQKIVRRRGGAITSIS